jgi:hypothetical protein
LNEDRLPKLPVTAESPNFQFAASPYNESTVYADFDNRVNLSHFQIWPVPGPKMFVGMFKIPSVQISRAGRRVSTSLCGSVNYGNAGDLRGRSPCSPAFSRLRQPLQAQTILGA